MTDPIPPVAVTTRRRPWDRVSLIWLVPLAALAVALVVAWQTVSQRGPLIAIVFDDAAGVGAGETELRFRDVAVGLVERVRFTPDLQDVVVEVRLDREVAPFVDEGAQFWIVEPQVTPQGITGIQTVLTGVFIEGTWDSEPGEAPDAFQGLDDAPLLRAGQEGLHILLRSTQGALTSAVPLLFNGVQVGQVGEPRVTADGFAVEADAVVNAPYDRLVTKASRFWDASGFRLSLDTGGADVAFDSLSSLIVGGLAFDTFVAGAPPAEDGDVFVAYYDEGSAREAAFGDPDTGPLLNVAVTFEGDAASLAEGAAVELDGLRVGQVAQVQGRIDPTDGGIRVDAVLAIEPGRLGLGESGTPGGGSTPGDVLDVLAAQVAEQGLRARLATGGLLGDLEVQLVPVADTPPATLDRDAQPYPTIPTTANDIADVAATAQGVIDRVGALPIEELLDSAIGFLDNAAVLAGSADTQAIPGDVRALLADVRGLTAAPEVQALPGRIGTLSGEAGAALAEVRALLVEVNEADVGPRLAGILTEAEATVAAVEASVAGVPALVERLDALAATANDLPLEALVTELTALAGSAEALVSAPGTQALPADLSAALAEAAALLREAREGGVVANANAALLAAREAAEGLPGLVERAGGVLDRAASAVGSFDATSGVVREAEAAIREVAAAADAVAGLARAIERDPNSLLFGR